METEVKKEADIIKDEDRTMVDIEEVLKITIHGKIEINLKEIATVKEIEKISADASEDGNVKDKNKIEVASVNESTKTNVEDENMIDTNEPISIDNKEESRTDIERFNLI